jgi:cytoskeleton protein RodZ
MFEIGSSLREARERRNLSYGRVEADTAIRTRYIRALEDEDFHILPGPTYTKGFLRAYAEYLGLDGQPFVDEFNSRHHDPRSGVEHQAIASRPRSRAQQRRRRRHESNLVMITLAAIVAVVSLVVLALRFPPQQTAHYNTNTAPITGHTPATSSTVQGQSTAGRHKRFQVTLTLSAPTWVEATIGSAKGRGIVTSDGLDLGAPHGLTINPANHPTITFSSRRPIYLALGAPGNVTLAINGHQVSLPNLAAPHRVRVDASGAHPA